VSAAKHFRDRVLAHKSLILPRGDAQQRQQFHGQPSAWGKEQVNCL
jgi:hypothetical protein